jgi:hypothetical protein
MVSDYDPMLEWEYIHDLFEKYPVLRDGLDENFDTYLEIGPTSFFSDLQRWVVSSLTREHLREDATAVLNDLEATVAAGSSRLEDLIAVGFIENLPYRHEPGGAIPTTNSRARTYADRWPQRWLGHRTVQYGSVAARL